MKRSIFLLFAIVSVTGMIAISGCHRPETYIVTFNANGGTGTMVAQTFTEGEVQSLSHNAFTYYGYTFTEWNSEQDGSGTTYSDRQAITITSDMTLYAQWSANTVTITFDANGGQGGMDPQTFTVGIAQELFANSFRWEKHEFTGWNTASDGTGITYTDMQEVTFSENVTLFAQWLSTTGILNGHEWVDLGLPSGTRWATCNIGASNPEDFGDYFAWGETEPKSNYSWSNYRWCNGSKNTLTKYCSLADYGNDGFTDALTSLEAADDAATVNWGSSWRMPTKEEFDELLNNCSSSFARVNGVLGRMYWGRNGNSIFLPAAGYFFDEHRLMPGLEDGDYWSSSITETPYQSWMFWLQYPYSGMHYNVKRDRYFGSSVRPVVAQ